MPHLVVTIPVPEQLSEMIIAELSVIGYDSFLEEDGTLQAYIEESIFNEKQLFSVLHRYDDIDAEKSTVNVLEEKNWNEEWEKNFEPIVVEDKVRLRATFHPAETRYPYELIIDPRMSFGTGHHATTYMMLAHQLEIAHEGKNVLDAGCGTAILAIMAEKRGAATVTAFDIDEWSVNNAQDNLALNDSRHVSIQQGEITGIDHPYAPYDIILANINRNILLKDMAHYHRYLAENGYLVLSGFYENDVQVLIETAQQYGLTLHKKQIKDKWASLVLK